jgi:uncharacterized protein (DUF433 family)
MTLPVILVPHPHVRVDPRTLGGSPFVVGSRVPVRRLWAFYARGSSVETLLKRYPQLGPAKVFDALAFAFDNPEVIEADVAREREILERAGHEPMPRAGGPEQIQLPFGGDVSAPTGPRRSSGRRRG